MGRRLGTRTVGHELDQRAVGVWKYACTGIYEYLKNQVENHSKIGNSVNNKNFNISKYNLLNPRKDNRDNMLESSWAKQDCYYY